MEQNYTTHYKRKFYSRKIAGIFVHAWLIAISAFMFAGFISSEISYNGSNENFFLFNVFAFLTAVYLVALAWINGVRIARLRDDVIGNRYPEDRTREDFWSGLFTKSLVALIILEVIFFIFLWVFIKSGAPWMLYASILVCMAGTLLIKLRYNAKVRDIRGEATYLAKSGREYAIHAKREKKFVVWFTLLWCFFLFCLIIYFAADGYDVGDGPIIVPIFAIIGGLIALIPEIQSINGARDDEELQEWIARQDKEQKEAEEKKNAALQEDEETDTQTQSENGGKNLFDEAYSDVGQPQYMHMHSIEALCEDFVDFTKDEGASVDIATAKEIFAAMFASRAVWLRSDNSAYAYRVAELIRKYFVGEEGVVPVKLSAFNNQSLFYSDSEEKNFIPLTKQLYTAQRLTNSVNVVVFKNAEQAEFSKIFEAFIKAFRAPEDDNKVSVEGVGGYSYQNGAYSQLSIPANLWCIFVGGVKSRLTASAKEYSSEVFLRHAGEVYTPSFTPVKNSFLSFARFGELLSEAMQKHFLSLDIWKKLDRLEEYLQGQIHFRISNPTARQIEQYSSVLLACGVSEQEVVDKVIETRIVPMLAGYKKEQINAEGNTLTETLDSLFGMDNLPRTQKALTDRGLF